MRALVLAACVFAGCSTVSHGTPNDAPSARDAGAPDDDAAAHVEDDSGAPLSDLAPNEGRWLAPSGTESSRGSLAPGAPLGAELTVSIPRYVGPYVAPGQSGTTLDDYVTIGALGALARIELRLKHGGGVKLHVECSNAQTGAGWRPVVDAAGLPLVLPDVPADGAWHAVSVAAPTPQLALARARGVPEANRFRLVVDSVAAGEASDVVAVDSFGVGFYAQAPIVLVHGINDNPENCFADYAAGLGAAGFAPDLAVNFSGLADKPGLGGTAPTYNGSVAADVTRIAERLSRLADDYGTRDVHLVGHSKGGLDLVNFLATKYAALSGSVRVLSLQTLASPHAGSVYADLQQPLLAWAKEQGYGGNQSWPGWGVVASDDTDKDVLDTLTLSGIKEAVLQGGGPIDPGLSDLRTTSAAVLVDQAYVPDPALHFATYGFDADFERARWLNAAGQVTTPPESGDVLPKYSTDCRGNPIGSNHWTYYCIDEDEVDTFFWGTAFYPPTGTTCSGWNECGAPLWRPMARGVRATVQSALATGGSRSTIHFESRPEGVWDGNDLVVSLTSATHPHAERAFQRVGAEPRSVPGQRRFVPGGGVETFAAACAHTGANHIALLRKGRANMVECTVADTTEWIRVHAPVP